jgi:hypothetical protein
VREENAGNAATPRVTLNFSTSAAEETTTRKLSGKKQKTFLLFFPLPPLCDLSLNSIPVEPEMANTALFLLVGRA